MNKRGRGGTETRMKDTSRRIRTRRRDTRMTEEQEMERITSTRAEATSNMRRMTANTAAMLGWFGDQGGDGGGKRQRSKISRRRPRSRRRYVVGDDHEHRTQFVDDGSLHTCVIKVLSET